MRLSDKSYLMRLGEQVSLISHLKPLQLTRSLCHLQCYVDAKDDLKTVARFINDCRNPNLYNVFFLKSSHDQCAYVITTREIHENEEIFVDYGRWYWVGKKPKRLFV
jgi:SET domain-containing protein